MQMKLTVNCTILRNNNTNMHKNSVVTLNKQTNNEWNLKMENEITQAKGNQAQST
jgi:hypothetical protein